MIIKEPLQEQPLILHSDNGSLMKATIFQVLLEKLGIQSSYSRSRVRNNNPYFEAVFHTLKYHLNILTTVLKHLMMRGMDMYGLWIGTTTLIFIVRFNLSHSQSVIKTSALLF